MYRNTAQLATGFMASLIMVIGLAPAASPHPQKETSKKGSSRPSVAALVTLGHTLFLSDCSPCHGADAQGDDGPNLHRKNLPDTFIITTVKTGFKEEMPPFAHIKTSEMTALVAYVHSIQK